MKRAPSLLLLAAIPLLASAAPEKILEVEIADKNALVAAAGKIGETIANPALGAMALVGIANNPVAETVGALRGGASPRVAIYVDGAPSASGKIGDILSRTFFAVAYPCDMDKEKFIAAKGPAAARDEGAYVKYDGMAYQFSDDGKWIAISEPKNGNVAKGLLAEAAAAPRLADGQIARITITERGLRFIGELFESDEAKSNLSIDAGTLEDIKELLATFKSTEFGLSVTDAGLDLTSEGLIVPGRKFSGFGAKPFASADPLAFAGRDAVSCSAYAEDAALADGIGQLEKLRDALAAQGVPFDWLSLDRLNAETAVISLDLPAAIEWAKSGSAEALLEKLDLEKLVEDVNAAIGQLYSPTSPAQALAFRVKGAAMHDTASARYAAALPEVPARRCFCVGFMSLYEGLKVVADIVADQPFAASEKATIKGVLATLPSVKGAGIAVAGWREGDRVKGIVRVTAAEIKGLYSAGMTAISLASTINGAAGSCCGGGDDEDDDED